MPTGERGGAPWGSVWGQVAFGVGWDGRAQRQLSEHGMGAVGGGVGSFDLPSPPGSTAIISAAAL